MTANFSRAALVNTVRVLALLAALMTGSGAATARAASAPGITIEISHGRLLNLPRAATSVFIADPAIADVQVPMPNRIFVFGKKAGRTTLYALASDGSQIVALDVRVENDVSDPNAELIRNPNAGDIHAVGSQNGLALEGTAVNPEAASDASRAANDALVTGQSLDDHVKIAGSAQVMIRVRIAEVSRSINKDLGINWNSLITNGAFQFGFEQGRQVFSNGGVGFNGTNTFTLAPNGDASLIGAVTGSHVNFSSVIDALSTEGLITTLAEPNLTAVSGQPASFLAGGEFPIPVVQTGGNGSQVTIVFKEYGVSLNFVPTVLSSNHISLRVRPEVSQLTNQGSIDVNGLVIPALLVRRADTTVELGSGETFAIGGLLQNDITNSVSRFPALGDLPVLGALFRSSNYQRNESELLIIVTPYIVKPVDDPNALIEPTDGLKPATDLERIFLGWIDAKDSGSAYANHASSILKQPRLSGDAGFDME